MPHQLLKADAFGRIELCRENGSYWVRRDTTAAHWSLRWLARRAATHEAKALAALSGIPGVPQFIDYQDGVLTRSFLAGEPMQKTPPLDPAWFRAAHRLLRQLRARGLAHNDLAKEPNWLVLADGGPGVVDFQLAWVSRRRGRLFRSMAREDLRHLLKHKRTYCPQALTPTERRILSRRSWYSRLWMATGKRLYKFIARRWFGYWDNEGQGRTRN
jgi:hypothetical protein